jgi:hypothetical protein
LRHFCGILRQASKIAKQGVDQLKQGHNPVFAVFAVFATAPSRDRQAATAYMGSNMPY